MRSIECVYLFKSTDVMKFEKKLKMQQYFELCFCFFICIYLSFPIYIYSMWLWNKLKTIQKYNDSTVLYTSSNRLRTEIKDDTADNVDVLCLWDFVVVFLLMCFSVCVCGFFETFAFSLRSKQKHTQSHTDIRLFFFIIIYFVLWFIFVRFVCFCYWCFI